MWLLWLLGVLIAQVVNKFFKTVVSKLLGQASAAITPEALTELLVAFVPHLETKNVDYLYKTIAPHLQLVRHRSRHLSDLYLTFT